MFAAASSSRVTWHKTVGPVIVVLSATTLGAMEHPQVAPRLSQSALRHLHRTIGYSHNYTTAAADAATTKSATPFTNFQPLRSLTWSFQRGFSASATPPASKSGGFLAWYEGHLQTRPVVTKMITGSFLWGIGDAVAQIVPHLASSSGTPMPAYDWPRTGRAVFFGFAIHAPASHAHFNFLEWMTVRAGFTGLNIPIFKTFMEQFVSHSMVPAFCRQWDIVTYDWHERQRLTDASL